MLCAWWLGCYGAKPLAPQTGSESHFLEPCSSDAECGPFACLHQVCTVPCQDDATCERIASGSACAVTGSQTCEHAWRITSPDAGDTSSTLTPGQFRGPVVKDAGQKSVSPKEVPTSGGSDGSVATGYAYDAAVDTGVLECPPGYGDCDSDQVGCETSLTTLDNCGGCAVPCALANAQVSCAPGSCVIVSCALDYLDCNALAADGCEHDVRTDGACP